MGGNLGPGRKIPVPVYSTLFGTLHEIYRSHYERNLDFDSVYEILLVEIDLKIINY